MPVSAIFPILLLLVSPAIGSFLGVLVDRLPRGLDVVRPRSACRECQTRLTPVDLVPLVSFVALRGRCRHCGAAIPAWVFYSEIAAVLAAVAGVTFGQSAVEMGLIALVLWLLWALALCDLLYFRLPDLLTGALFLVTVIWAVMQESLPIALTGTVAGAGSFWLLRVGYRATRGRDGLGLGDVKLMAGLGALVGTYFLPLTVLIAAVLALIWARGTKGGFSATRPLPFGAALSAAAVAVWLGVLSGN